MDSIKLFIDLVHTGNTDPFVNFTDFDYTRFMDDISQSGILKLYLSHQQAKNLSKLLNTFPADNLLPFWKIASRANIQNTVMVHRHIAPRLVEVLRVHEHRQ